MPGTVRKPSEVKDPDPADNVTPENENDTTTKDAPSEETPEELNPVQVPENWEKVNEADGGGIRPTQVPWPGYENA